MGLRITVLGSGNSTGVPFADGTWGNCDAEETRNRRRRASILIERNGTRVLVDAGPDIRDQMLSAKVDRLDAVIFTHAHADHTAGIDDLRVFGMFGHDPLPIYAYPEVLDQLRSRFGYMFGSGRKGYYDKPTLHANEALPEFSIGALDFRLFDQDHTVCRSAGIRTGRFAYSTDVKSLSDAAFDTLAGLEVWLVAAVRREPHIAHAHLDVVLDWIRRVQPARTFLTHMNHTMDYRTLFDELPDGVMPAFDGQVMEFDD